MDHGIFSAEQLFAQGVTTAQIRKLMDNGTLERLRRGWYSYLGAAGPATAAIRAGAHLGCLSGCKVHGLWTPPHEGIHAAYGRGITPSRKSGLILHPYAAKQTSDAIWPLEDCIIQVFERHDAETALIIAESAVASQVMTQEMAAQLLSRSPHRDLIRFLSRARSGSETRVRLFLQRRNVQVRPLVAIPGVGEVDLLVGDRTIIECDSLAHHGTPEAQAHDSVRDLNGHLLDYHRIRLTFQQIWHTWPETQASLSALLQKRRHTHRLRESKASTPEGKSRAAELAHRHAQRRRIHSVGYDESLRDIL